MAARSRFLFNLRAGSLLSHLPATESKVIGREGVWWRSAKKVSLAWSLHFSFFICASPLWSEIPLVEKQERRENCHSIMFDEERLDPKGSMDWIRSINGPYVITTKNKSSIFKVRGRVECSYRWCFTKVPVHFWLNFKIKRWLEIADCTREELNITNVGDFESGQQNNARRFACLLAPSETRCQSKITWNQVRVLGKHKLWRLFFIKILSTTYIALASCYEKEWAAKVRTVPVKISWLIFFRRISRDQTKRLALLDFSLAATSRALEFYP